MMLVWLKNGFFILAVGLGMGRILLRNIFGLPTILTVLLFLIPTQGLAQRYHIQTYREQDGLSSNTVYNVVQDSLGRLWFATRNGLTVFDGFEWREIRPNDPASPRGEGLVAMASDGAIWWSSRRLPLRISRWSDDQWQGITNLTIPGQYHELIRMLTWVDPQGETTLAVATHGGILRIWKNQTWITPKFDLQFSGINSLEIINSILLVSTNKGLVSVDLQSPKKPYKLVLDLPERLVGAVSCDAQTGIMWIIGDTWLARYQDWKLLDYFPIKEFETTPLNKHFSACQGPLGGLYIVDSTTVYYFHPEWGLETISPAKGIVTDGGFHVMMDREKNIWISSSRGVSKIISRRFACYDHVHGLMGDEVSAIIQRASGSIVLGHRNGLTFMDPEIRTLPFTHGSGVFTRVTDLAEDANERLWIAANYQGLGLLAEDDTIHWYNSEDGLGKSVYSILPHPDLGLLVGTNSGLFRKIGSRFEEVFLPETGSTNYPNIRRLITLSTGEIAIGTMRLGIYLWQKGELTRIPGSSEEGSNNVFALFERPDGRLWVGTGSGLFVLNQGKLVRTQAPDPEIHRPVYGMVEDDIGKIWFGTDDGVTIWDGKETNRLTAHQGLLGFETNRDALIRDKKGHIWIGTDSGLSIYRRELDTAFCAKPILTLTGVRANGQSFPLDRPLKIKGPLASLIFLFRAPYFGNGDHLRFQVKTTGISDIEIPSHIVHWPGVLPLTNIPPGNLQVRIQALTPEGLVSNTITTPMVTVIPPFKDRWYTKLLAAMALGLLMWLLLAFLSGRRSAQRLEKEVRHQTRDLRRSEETARLESERLTSTLESISDGVVVMDSRKKVVLFNGAAETMFRDSTLLKLGCALEDLLPLTALVDPNQATRYKQLLENPDGVRLQSEQVPIHLLDNSTGWFEISAVPIIGSPGALVFAFRDITDRRNSEQEEQRSQKLESLGLLAGGIAHDFNNLLTIMLGNLSLAESTLTASPEERRQLGKIRTASERAQSLTRQLLTFAKGGGPARKPIDLVPIIKDSTSFTLSGSNVTQHLKFPPDLLWINADPDQITQVIGNLIINAFQAMPNGGHLEIAAHNISSGIYSQNSEQWVVIEIRDHGVGIADQDQLRIFDPYFSTKKAGSGLGLAIAHSIVEKHEGQLTVSSVLGEGSTFRLALPACQPGLKPGQDKIKAETFAKSGPLKILFMDDEEEIRLILDHMLNQAGHHGMGVAHGEDALDAFIQARRKGTPFDLVVLDLTIPGGMGGLETLSELRKLDPQVKVIVASGYCDDPVMANFFAFGFSGILRKPFSLDDLQQVIRGLPL